MTAEQTNPGKSPSSDGASVQHAIAHAEQVTKYARTSWLGLLGFLAFAGVTLLGVEDKDFFAYGVQTELPLIGVSIPTSSFFWTAPVLATALYVHLHLYLLKLWKIVFSLPDRIDGEPLGARLWPWLVTDWALARRGDQGTPLPLRTIQWLLTVGLVWLAGPLVLFGFWWRSMVKHDVLLAAALGLLLVFALYVGAAGWVFARKWLTRARSLPARVRRRAAVYVLMALLVLWLSVEGTTTRILLPYLVSAQLVNAQLSVKPADWLDREFARLDFLKEYRERRGLTARTELAGEEKEGFEDEWLLRRAEYLSHIDKPILEGADLRGAFMSGAFLAGVDLSGANLSGAHLDRAHLEGADLHWAHLEGAILSRAHLEGADLIEAHLEGAYLQSAHLEGADLIEAHLEGAYLQSAHLEGAILSRAHLAGADLQSADLEGANLIEAHLEGAHLDRAHLEGADLDRAHLEGADLQSADLAGANLARADLAGAILFEAHLEGAVLALAHLEGAGLAFAHLEGANLQEAHLEGADLTWAHLEGAHLDRAHLEGADLSWANLVGAVLWGADLRDAKNLEQGQLDGAIGDEDTMLPDGLTIPSCWTELPDGVPRPVWWDGPSFRERALCGDGEVPRRFPLASED